VESPEEKVKTIVIDARELRTSSGRYVERLLHYLQQLDSDHQYKVLLKPQDISDWQPLNANFEPIPCPHKEFTFGEQFGLLKQLNQLNADLVHFAFPQQPVLYSGKTVTTIHDLTTLRFTNPDKNMLIFKLKQRVYSHVIKRAARKSTFVLSGTDFVKDDVTAFAKIDAHKIVVTPEAADPIKDAPLPLPELENTPFIMYVGRPTPHKNLQRLIEAFILLKPQHPDLKLVLAGKKDANYRRIEAGLPTDHAEDIIFTDFISEGELRWLYENCQAYVFPSLSEGFGLPGLEAMQHGAPVISSDATCLPEVYGSAAHYFDPLNTKAITQAINEVLTDTSLRDSLIAAGTKQVQQFSWRRMAEQTLDVYNKSLSA
jgi:glycosyltransferase involved in cell wall biosynthesis